tara:strand:- start:285 stop:1019 length:735 start_codon:yes stop_codon:yes gene_type:complete
MFLTNAIKKANEFAKKGVTIVTHGLNIWVAQFVEGGEILPPAGETGATQWLIPHPTKDEKFVSFTSQVKDGNNTELQNGAALAVAVLSDGSLKKWLEENNKSLEDYNLSDLQKFLTSQKLESRDIRTIAPVIKSMIKDNVDTKKVVNNFVKARDLAIGDGAKIAKARETAVKAVLKEADYTMPVKERIDATVGNKFAALLDAMAGTENGEQMVAELSATLTVDNAAIARVLANVIVETSIPLAS